MKKILEVTNLNAGYDKRKILYDINLELFENEKVLLIGPNGSGKSTLLKSILGIIPVQSGTVIYNETNITNWSIDKRINLGIGYLPQTNNFFPSLTVYENLNLAGFKSNPDYFKQQIDFVYNVFPFLKKMQKRRAGLLSGGERQALALSMVLMKENKLLILDEPTAGLSPAAAKDIIEALKKIIESINYTLLIVEHNISYFHDLYSRAIIIREGYIVVQSISLTKEKLEKYFFNL